MHQQRTSAGIANSIPLEAFRKPQRMTITLPYSVYATLISQSDSQGRSLSNYAAFILEQALLSTKDAQNHR
jgi:hypothetical protein